MCSCAARACRYDGAQWELLRRLIAAANISSINDVMGISRLPNGKTDVNNKGPISTDVIGASWFPVVYATATPADRAAAYAAHKLYTQVGGCVCVCVCVWGDGGGIRVCILSRAQSFLYFLTSDDGVPASMRAEMASWGYAADEWSDNGHWPYELYVREAVRLVSDVVFTQRDRTTDRAKASSIGLGSYNIDSHHAQRVPQGAWVYNDGDVELFYSDGPFEIPYEILRPPPDVVANVLTTVRAHARAWSVARPGLGGEWRTRVGGMGEGRTRVGHAGAGLRLRVACGIRLTAPRATVRARGRAFPRGRGAQWFCVRISTARARRYMIMGQSAGVAAARAAAAGVPVTALDVKALQARLIALGQLIFVTQ